MNGRSPLSSFTEISVKTNDNTIQINYITNDRVSDH
jgi:hypothetical protein